MKIGTVIERNSFENMMGVQFNDYFIKYENGKLVKITKPVSYNNIKVGDTVIISRPFPYLEQDIQKLQKNR